jgi:cyclase
MVFRETGMLFKSKSRVLLIMATSIGLLAAARPISAQTERRVTKLTDGVYAIEHRPGGGGNTTVIIGERQVFVVDSCFLPSAAREDIAQIRQWTDKPVSFVLNTHFHNDHNLGNRAYTDAFPAVTIIAHAETKKEMDRFGPGSASREEKTTAAIQQMLATGKTEASTYLPSRSLNEEEKAELKNALAERLAVLEELKKVKFQSATLTFDREFNVDLGNREVRVKFLGRGNTAGDTVAYLPKEKIVVAGDLVAYPIPNTLDGYPSEWIETLEKLAQLDADTIVPGHGAILHDKAYIFLLRDLMKSAVEQMNAKLKDSFPAMFQTLDDVKGAVDLSTFRQRFAGTDKDLSEAFDDMAASLVKVVFEEASLR